MKDIYIEWKEICRCIERICDCVEDADFDGIKSMFLDAKPADVRPVVRGRWELHKDGWCCSVCELYPPFDCDPEEKGIPHCPWCGADMREENNGRTDNS